MKTLNVLFHNDSFLFADVIQQELAHVMIVCRSFATRVSQLKIWHFLVIGIERCVCRDTFNSYSVITQFVKLATGEQLCSRCTHRKSIALQNL